jgi:hypothetical protein
MRRDKQLSLTLDTGSDAQARMLSGLMLGFFLICAFCGFLPQIMAAWPDGHQAFGDRYAQAAFLQDAADVFCLTAIGLLIPFLFVRGCRCSFQG